MFHLINRVVIDALLPFKAGTSCVGLDLCGLRWVSDLGVRCVVPDLLEEEPDLLTLMVGSSRCLVTGERSILDSPAAWGVVPIRRAAATSTRRERAEQNIICDFNRKPCPLSLVESESSTVGEVTA